MRNLLIAVAVACIAFSSAVARDAKEDVNTALTSFHTAASKADWDTYFGLLTEDSVFMGTDASERWSKAEFQSYASKTRGWTYTKENRFIYIAADGNTAWFDEILNNEKYGTSRGTGVLIRTNDGWKIIQYNLTFPIPNDLAAGITQEIQTFEARQKVNP